MGGIMQKDSKKEKNPKNNYLSQSQEDTRIKSTGELFPRDGVFLKLNNALLK